MVNTGLMPIKFDMGETISSVLNGPHGNAAIFGCTICALAAIAGYCYLTGEGHQVALPFGRSRVQTTDVVEETM